MQCCGSEMFIPDPTFSIPVPGSEIFPSRFPDPKFFHSGSTSKNLSILTQKIVFLSSRKYDPGCSSRIRILIFYPSRIQVSKRHRIPDSDPQHCKDVSNKNRLTYSHWLMPKKDKWFHASYICLEAEGGVSVGPILDEFALESASSIFLGRGLNALAGSPDSLNIITSVKYVENHLLRWTKITSGVVNPNPNQRFSLSHARNCCLERMLL